MVNSKYLSNNRKLRSRECHSENVSQSPTEKGFFPYIFKHYNHCDKVVGRVTF